MKTNGIVPTFRPLPTIDLARDGYTRSMNASLGGARNVTDNGCQVAPTPQF
jgi:hypothetical protein